ncbi:DUF1302 domain-containing protein [Pseudomonas umsongensis]|uniref:DUF1302 domain-containing protein n=1 Tax=Pseudomonas umsongensis TaxID=198618 RepID=UPI00200A24F3|nr:DUF1302 domain-containing protein [Pseudomonas umsongensis]MCK8683328.1 DUF1302 domain-containing protein [Pseudomonas umsongensis]
MNGLKRSGANLTLLAVAVAAFSNAGSALAESIDVGNPDVSLRWDNTVRYNIGMRAQKQEKALSQSATQQISDNKFDRGDLVTNRLDILSEVDLVYKERYGARVSAAGWYDDAYDDKAEGLPAYQAAGLPPAYSNNKYTGSVKRYYMGPSGEILDAFVFGGFDLGNTPVNFKLGRHNLYWGESLFSFVHGVSYAQGPVDIRKATATPGIEAKELFLPLNQLSVQTQLTDSVSMAAYYQFEWDSNRLPEGGTYFGTADFLFLGNTTFPIAPGFGVPFEGDQHTPKNSGAWGVNTKWDSEALGGNLGFYYREFSDTMPNVVGTFDANGVPTQFYNKYAENVRLYGISLSKQVGKVSVGAEVVRRENTALSSIAGSPDFARGNTWHGLVNAIASFGGTPVWDSAILQGELTYSYLDKVTKNSNFYNEEGNPGCPNQNGGKGDAKDGCSTRDALGLQLAFTPTWYQAFEGVDLTMPLTFSRGLYGTSPVANGGNEGAGNFSVGIGADYLARYKVDLAYNGFYGPITTTFNPVVGQNTVATSSGGTPLLRDRGWVSLTFKTSF